MVRDRRRRQQRLDRVDAMLISLVANGLTTGEVQDYPAEVYGTHVSRETISKIADRILDVSTAGQPTPGPGSVRPMFTGR